MKRDLPFYSIWFGFALFSFLALYSEYYFLAPIVPIIAAVLYLLYRFPEYGLFTLAFFVPLEGLFAGNKLFTGPKLVGFVLILIIILKLIRKEIPVKQILTPVWIPIALLILSFGMSTLLSEYHELSTKSLRKLVIAVSVFFVAMALRDRVDIIQFMRVVVFSVASTAAMALFSSGYALEDRAVGLLTDPNYFALLLVIAFPLALYLVLYDRNRLLKTLWFISLIFVVLAFQKTLSRSGLLVLAVVAAVLLFHYRFYLKRFKTTQKVLAMIGIFTFAVFAIILSPSEYKQRMLSLSNLAAGVSTFEDRSLGRRTSYIIVAWKSFKENPILGSGPGTFPVYYAKTGYAAGFSLDKDEPEIFRRAHNTYLETVAESGLLGLVSLGSIVLIGMWQYMKLAKMQSNSGEHQQSAVYVHCFASFLAIILFFLFLTGINNKIFWILLAFSCGLSTKLPLVTESSRKKLA